MLMIWAAAAGAANKTVVIVANNADGKNFKSLLQIDPPTAIHLGQTQQQ
jgi:hypothetical protein